MDLVVWCGASNKVNLDAKIGACFSKSRVCGVWEDPVRLLVCYTAVWELI
jgi:hypothetical protein